MYISIIPLTLQSLLLGAALAQVQPEGRSTRYTAVLPTVYVTITDYTTVYPTTNTLPSTAETLQPPAFPTLPAPINGSMPLTPISRIPFAPWGNTTSRGPESTTSRRTRIRTRTRKPKSKPSRIPTTNTTVPTDVKPTTPQSIVLSSTMLISSALASASKSYTILPIPPVTVSATSPLTASSNATATPKSPLATSQASSSIPPTTTATSLAISTFSQALSSPAPTPPDKECPSRKAANNHLLSATSPSEPVARRKMDMDMDWEGYNRSLTQTYHVGAEGTSVPWWKLDDDENGGMWAGGQKRHRGDESGSRRRVARSWTGFLLGAVNGV